MRTKYLITVLAVFLVWSQHAEAQFLNRLQKRVEEKVENVVVEKSADKAAEKTSNSMDKVLDGNPFVGGKGKADSNLVANTYAFTWKYSLKMTTKDGEIVFDYYLKPGATYFGFTSVAMKSMFTVMDNGNNVTVMFMESQGNNMGMVTQLPNDLGLEDAQDESTKFTFEQLPDKTLKGYLCKGVKATNDAYEMVMYFTNEAEVSFDDIYKNSKTKIPVQLKDYFGKDEKVLMISMDMKNLKKKKESATMECVGLEKVNKTIKKSDYKFM